MNLNWFDIFLLTVICVGIWVGRKRGISEELLDMLQWISIVVAGAYLYRYLGQLIASTTKSSLLLGNVSAYTLIAILVKLLFTMLKRSVGEKLVESDAFGRFEYYLGMIAGAVRFACIVLFVINFIHARVITDAELAANARMQKDNFGSISFPTIGSLRVDIFTHSASGQFLLKHARMLFLDPVLPGASSGENIYQRRQRDVDEVLK